MSESIVEAPYEVAGIEAPASSSDYSNSSHDSNGGDSVQDVRDPLGSVSTAFEDADKATNQQQSSDSAATEDVQDTVISTEKAEKATREDAQAVLEKKNLDIAKYEQEFMANGGLSEASYKELEKAGIQKQFVDSYIKGNQAVLNQFLDEVYSIAGGKDEYANVTQWAQDNMGKEYIDAYNKAMFSGDTALIKMTVAGLAAQYQAAEGKTPTLIRSGKTPSGASSKGASYASAAEMVEAMRDKRYGNDPAYTRDVERKVANSSFFG